ncbi:MAG TPA: nucleoside deaminase [Thermoanaerobaculia bacterium]|jgi:tRNA(adenine34) deaminase|nr:nucleoside deaminase [Thermoanaerobaculia bacterium]
MTTRIDEAHMRRCLELGRAALTVGEVPVGALIVRGEAVVGEGFEETRALPDPSAHAEVQAIRAACRSLGSADLSGCTLYTTVEPCVLCAYVVRRTGVSRVVYGVPAGQLGGASSRYAILQDPEIAGWPAPPEILAGVLAEECQELLRKRVR